MSFDISNNEKSNVVTRARSLPPQLSAVMGVGMICTLYKWGGLLYRYHQQGRWYMVGEGPDHEIHGWPSPELGIRLGG